MAGIYSEHFLGAPLRTGLSCGVSIHGFCHSCTEAMSPYSHERMFMARLPDRLLFGLSSNPEVIHR